MTPRPSPWRRLPPPLSSSATAPPSTPVPTSPTRSWPQPLPWRHPNETAPRPRRDLRHHVADPPLPRQALRRWREVRHPPVQNEGGGLPPVLLVLGATALLYHPPQSCGPLTVRQG